MDECCCQTGPPSLQIARAASVMSVRTFHTFVFSPLFFGRRWFRQADVHATDNTRCAPQVVPEQACGATIPIFSTVFSGAFDPCTSTVTLVPRLPFTPGDTGMGCRLSGEFSNFDCWDAAYTFTVETTPADIIAGCLSNLALIDLDQVPFGTERRVTNDPFNGSPTFSDTLISAVPTIAATCPNPFNHQVACSFSFQYSTIGDTRHCNQRNDAFISIPTQHLIATASRSRFSSNANWCKRTRGPIYVDPDFVGIGQSTPGPCADIACAHYLPASGIFEVPPMNQSIHIALCSTPPVQCNQTPILF
jgi:hypothetical protein